MKITVEYDSGVYVLEIFLHKPRKIEIGKKGLFIFPPGYYYYCGTAQKNLRARLERHASSDKRPHWHIDYLLADAFLHDYYTWPEVRESECKLANFFRNELKGEIIVPGFGASDCDCESHLFYFAKQLPADTLSELDLSSLN